MNGENQQAIIMMIVLISACGTNSQNTHTHFIVKSQN